ncbi:putative phosphoribosyltransferase [Methanocella conradii HZ254]|uniref:Phosphoribosyltransferase n=1 Tax=Methanocella conradii (strain DSM 24694 / JCM 17849 / CGMCC 1.5162 / HZ254) TaxID=1041930 RepID=H8IA71_METCZ|nr:phosphoribosyltransferase [Methanocella conradii]AFC99137.1 putative phosphoribosyltransferase [Methanocella conradii HZ254]
MIFKDRRDAGRMLAEHLVGYRHNSIILAIPRGGVPVGYEVSRRLGVPLDLIIPRKLPIPSDPEAGFGAVAPDGTVVLNERLVAYLGLSVKDIERIVAEVLKEVRRRIREYRGDRPLPDLKGKNVIIVDDGLASGYTMIAAVRAVRKERPRRVIVAVPCSPETSVERLEKEADEVICLRVQRYGPFAVASHYEKFPDLSDEEVKSLLAPAQG